VLIRHVRHGKVRAYDVLESFMSERKIMKAFVKGLGAAAFAAGAAYGGLVVYNRWTYGTAKASAAMGEDPLLDRFIPVPEVAEHHRIEIDAPAALVLSTANEMHVLDSPIIRAIFKLRELALGGEPDTREHPTELMAQMQSIGWVVLAEEPGREIVFGAVTQPWQATPTFRSIPPAEFKDFAEPGYVKIAWTLRADPLGEQRSMFHTETRVTTTDAEARSRFRTYWSFVAPGVELIRLAMLRPLKHAAEYRQRRHSVASAT
jgi:hypothetical protein